jgi:hypothetical protein
LDQESGHPSVSTVVGKDASNILGAIGGKAMKKKPFKHKAGWFQKNPGGRHHFFDNNKHFSICGLTKLRQQDLKYLNEWAFARNECLKCNRMVL